MIKRLLMRIKTKKEEKIKEEKKREELRKDGLYIVSENANPDNILLDTCALKNKKGFDIIKASNKVNILFAVLEEMDKIKRKIGKKKHKTRKEWEFISNVSKFLDEILQNSKYKIILRYNKKNEYVDNIILRYLKFIPRRKRPTLLTADKLLAAKARGQHLEYIYITEKQIKKTKSKKSETKKVESQQDSTKNDEPEIVKNQTPKKSINNKINVVGISISYNKNNITIKKYCMQSKIFLVKHNKCKQISSNTESIDSNSFDYIVAINYMTKYKAVKIVKIKIEKEDIVQEINCCNFVNEIYKLPIHETVLEQAKNLIAKV